MGKRVVMSPQPSGQGSASDPVTLSQLIDASAAAELLSVPVSWVRAEARADRIPHVRLGRYVRFDPAELFEWAHNGRHRGPRGGGR